jgi:hypothetical protein
MTGNGVDAVRIAASASIDTPQAVSVLPCSGEHVARHVHIPP